MRYTHFNPLSANPIKWSNTRRLLPTNCLCVFDYFMELALKGSSMCKSGDHINPSRPVHFKKLPYYTVSNKCSGAEVKFLSSSGLFYLLHLINKLPLISNKNLLVPWTKMMKSSKEGEWSQNKKCPSLRLSTDDLTLLKANGEISIYSPDVIFSST